MSAALLRMRGIGKQFAGVPALTAVDFELRAGEVHALMGENGAGKSTLMRVLAGALEPDRGRIELDGQTLRLAAPAAARRAGIAMVHQELALAPNLRVDENLFLGQELRHFGVFRDRATMFARATTELERLGCRFRADAQLAELALADRQLVEIARGLLHRARVLILDEPTTSLSERETERLFALINRLRGEGVAIVYISHRMAEVHALADRITVLRDGRLAGVLERAQARPDVLIGMMVGRGSRQTPHEATEFRHPGENRDPGFSRSRLDLRPPRGDEVPTMVFKHFSDQRGRVRDVSFELARGEILGLAGLVGSGRTELARLIFGADPRQSGELRIQGRVVPIHSPRQALAAGIAYLPEDRRSQGLCLGMAVSNNLLLSQAAQLARMGWRRGRREVARAGELSTRFAIRCVHLGLPVAALSGGNQQKVLLARVTSTHPRLLILDEPTRGVDVGAKQEIHTLIRQLAAQGDSILLISSELPELTALAQRIVVMREGRLVANVLPGSDGGYDEHALLTHAFGEERRHVA